MSDRPARRQYKAPPIEEALVEFHFAPGREWDLTIPGKLHQRVNGTYPNSRQQTFIKAAVQASPGQAPGVSVQEALGRVQLVDSSGKKLLSLGPNVLSINVLRPYEGWATFQPRINDALMTYAEVAEVSHVNRIGVRYINKVVLPTCDISIERYFRCGPNLPHGLPPRLSGALARTEHLFDDGIKLILTFATMGQDADESTFLVDVDVIWEAASPLDLKAAIEMVDELHAREGGAFEATITDLAREVFDAD